MRVKAAFGIVLATISGFAFSQQEIKVSYQPALYWSLPYYIASEKGWWGELGLKPTFSTFPAGVPQIAASAAKSWDVGGVGSVPAVLGAARYNLLTIGITNDESHGNALLASKAKADAFVKNPASIKGQTIVLTANSTGDYAVQSCLAKWGLKKADVSIKSMGQAEIISAMSSGNADLGGLWAPNIYTLEEKAGAKLICSGRSCRARSSCARTTRRSSRRTWRATSRSICARRNGRSPTARRRSR
jgi:ABC-type nitrate/sulfonate/bicarbonate transport system substrate-binding protein